VIGDGPAPEPKGVYDFWMTRDLEADVVSEVIKVWLARPTRKDTRTGARWGHDDPAALYAEWSIATATKNARTYPDDARQCIRVSGDKVWETGEDVDRSRAV
jgi:hypothetical protein